jgi:aminopeptidase N
MWIHEGFTAYSESVYIECRWGKEDALKYLKGTRRAIGNDSPIIGDYGVNSEGSGDMYYKGSNLLNTIRSIYNDDALWWKTLKDYTETYKHQNINTETTEAFFDRATKTDLQPIFDQYLRHSEIPELQFKKDGNEVLFRWKADVDNFQMPVDIFVKEKEIRLNPTSNWQNLPGKISLDDLEINEEEFYIDTNLYELK